MCPKIGQGVVKFWCLWMGSYGENSYFALIRTIVPEDPVSCRCIGLCIGFKNLLTINAGESYILMCP